MAKTNMVQREHRRAKIVKKYAAKRAQLKELIRSPKSSPEVRADAQAKLQKLPRDASPSRGRNRCAITGRCWNGSPGHHAWPISLSQS